MARRSGICRLQEFLNTQELRAGSKHSTTAVPRSKSRTTAPMFTHSGVSFRRSPPLRPRMAVTYPALTRSWQSFERWFDETRYRRESSRIECSVSGSSARRSSTRRARSVRLSNFIVCPSPTGTDQERALQATLSTLAPPVTWNASIPDVTVSESSSQKVRILRGMQDATICWILVFKRLGRNAAFSP